MDYRRALVPGRTYFFTANLADRSSRLLVEHITVLRRVVHEVKERHPFEVIAWVVLPDHIHTLWTLRHDDADFATRMALIKGGFSRCIEAVGHISESRTRKGERGIWQRRFWEHLIRDENDLVQHVDYIHINPVKHGYVEKANDWPWSSIHGYIRDGLLTAEWAADSDDVQSFGERRR